MKKMSTFAPAFENNNVLWQTSKAVQLRVSEKYFQKKMKINLETAKRPQYICRPDSKSEKGLVEKFFDIMQQRTGKLF